MNCAFAVRKVFGTREFCAVLLAVGAVAWTSAFAAPAVTLTVQGDKPGAAISQNLYGVFFEDINYAADGGLYAELIQNRSFEFAGADGLFGWSQVQEGAASGTIAVETERPLNANNPHFLRLQNGEAEGALGVANNGYDGIPLKKGENYLFSIYARSVGAYRGELILRLDNAKGEPLDVHSLTGLSDQWINFTTTFKPTASATNAHLVVLLNASGTVDIDMVSLFPEKTFKERPNGVRADLGQMLADLKPSFMRFPGGCIVEGKDLANSYRWKDTIGDVAERRMNWDLWQDSMPSGSHYYQSYGLGFFEFFQLCEDIGAEPLPVLNCGMSCQFRSKQLVPLDELEPYIQDALDLVEFANGPATSPWGAKRAAMGHPEPFKMKMLAIGNEQWGDDYFARYERFASTLKTNYPEIQIVASAGPQPAGNEFDKAWTRLKKLNADIVDEHYYKSPSWFFGNVGRYDRYDRTGPRVFAGEYAAHTTAKRNNLEAALAESAFLTGIERNSDVVAMASYAPLFARIGYTQWPVNLIWFNRGTNYGSPSYYAQQLFSVYRGDVILPVQIEDSRTSGAASGRIVLGTYHTEAEFKDVKVTRGSKTLFTSNFEKKTHDWQPSGGAWVERDGTYHQTDKKTIATAIAGDVAWSDYTLTLKARKRSGDEGFLIAVRNTGDDSQVQWNLGGWDNKQHGIQSRINGDERIVSQVAGSIEPWRWYDIKIESKGTRLDCYLDGVLVQTADVPAPRIQRFFATASRDDRNDKVIVKAVNPTSESVSVDVRLPGMDHITSKGQAIVLTSDNPADENSMIEPAKVVPVTSPLSGVAAKFRYKFKPYSVTILRLDARP